MIRKERNTINKDIAKNIKELRLHRGLELDKVATKCQVDVSTYEKWESGEIEPTCHELYLISNAIHVDMRYFFEEIGCAGNGIGYHSENCDLIMLALLELSSFKNRSVGLRSLLWRRIREYILKDKLESLDTPVYSVKYTTEKQRKDIIMCFKELFGDEYQEILDGYINGSCELSKLRDEIDNREEEHRAKEAEEKKIFETPAWKTYRSCMKNLSFALDNRFIDLRYATLAVKDLGKYLSEYHDGVNDSVFELIQKELKMA